MKVFGEDAPAWMCITGPNYRVLNDREHVKTGFRNRKACVLITPKGERIPCKSLGEAAVKMGGCSHDSRNYRKSFNEKGFYQTRSGWRIELMQGENNAH